MLTKPLISLSALLLLLAPTAGVAQAPNGALLYKAKCASCHGPNGEGTKRYKHALHGERSVAQLADVIGKTMPESAPGSLSAAESRALAVHVHDAFYSRLARERNRPARIELARLTVSQYRHAVADLIGGFRWQRPDGAERGLKAEYFKGRRFNPRERVLERTDPQVAFDFGIESPVPGKALPEQFSIRWSGALLADRTGEHEFVVRTEHAARLWVNDAKTPLIDGWVKSGNDVEYKATLFLVGGRAYPLRLEYSKAKQGVDDSAKKNKRPLAKSSIALKWKEPHGALGTIPQRSLSPAPAPEVFVCSTPFPPDDRSLGWERGTAVSKEWDQATTEAALEIAGHVANRINELAGTRDGAPDANKKIQAFCHKFAERAFRSPLTPERKAAIDRQFAAGKDTETAVKRALLLVLKSPRFLYREVGGGPDGLEVAARLSFGLWNSLPDQELLAAATTGRLASKEQVAKQAERMLRAPLGKAKFRSFLMTYLKADESHDLTKDTKKFPGFDAAVISDLRTSLELSLDDLAWSDSADFRQLFLSEQLFLNGRLAKFYGGSLPPDADFRKVKLDAGRRAGALTHPYLMAGFAHSSESSPIHRGVFLARGVLGVALRPPPEAVAPLAPDLHPKLTTRERVILQTSPPTCMTCHGIINPLGLTLEHFDAVGRYREKDNGKPVDSTGGYQQRDGKTVRVKGARELATFLADAPEAQAAFAEQLFHHLAQQPVRAYGPNALEDLRRSFAGNGLHIRKLAVEVMTLTAMRSRVGREAAPVKR